MSKYAKIAASEGYEFKITAPRRYEYTADSYRTYGVDYSDVRFEGRCGEWIGWIQMSNPTIELVKIPEPTKRPEGECPLCKGLRELDVTPTGLVWMGREAFMENSGNAVADKRARRFLYETMKDTFDLGGSQ